VADLYYIESGYLTPDSGYYTYIADAAAAPSSNFALDCNVTVVGAVTEADASLSSTFSLSAIGSIGKEAIAPLTSSSTLEIAVMRIVEATAEFTSAFSPSLSVVVFKNHIAVLEITTTLSTTPVVNRSITQTLDTIASLNAMAERTVGISLEQTATFTQTVSTTKSVVASADLSSSFSISIEAFNVQFAQASLSSTTSLTTTKLAGSRRPIVFNPTFLTGGKYITQGEFLSSDALGGQVKYGTHSLYRGRLTSSTLNQFSQQRTNTDFYVKANEQFSIEYWFRRNSQSVASDYATGGWPFASQTGGTYSSQINGFTDLVSKSGGWGLGLGYENSNGARWRFRYAIGYNTFNTIDSTVGNGSFALHAPADTWIHIGATRGADGVIRLYKDGNEIASQNYSGEFYYYEGSSGTTPNPIRVDSSYFIGGTTGGGAFIDEFSFQIGSNQLLGLNSQIGNTEYHQALLHIDGNGNDDTATLLSGAASMAVTATITAQSDPNTKSATATLTSTATLSSSITVVKVAAADLTTAVSLDCGITIIKTTAAYFESVASEFIDYTRTRNAEASFTSAFAPSLIISPQRAGVALLESISTLTASVSVVNDGTADFETNTALEAIGNSRIDTAIALATASTLTIDFVHYVGVASASNSEFALSANNYRVRNALVPMSVAVTVSATSTRIKQFNSSTSSTATLSAAIKQTKGFSSAISSTVTVSATGTRIQPASAAFTGTFTETVTVKKFVGVSADIQSAFSQTAQSIINASANAALTSAFSPTITARASVSNGSDMQASVTLSALTGVIRQFPGNVITGAATGNNANYFPQILDFDQTQFPSVGSFDIRDPNWTFGVWIKRESRTNYFESIASSTVDVGGLNNKAAIAFRGSNIRFRFNYDPDEPGATWYDVAPNDTEWHHYLFRSVVNSSNQSYPVNNWMLWVDGVSQGITDDPYNASGDLPWCGRYGSDFQNQNAFQGGLKLGFELLSRDGPGYDYNEAPLNGAFAQAWMGRVTDQQFNVNKFYDGPLNLGTTGTATGLPTPIFYNRLTEPYTGVTWYNDPGFTIPATQPLSLPSLRAQFNLTADSVFVLTAIVNATATATLTAQARANKGIIETLSSEFTSTVIGNKSRQLDSSLSTEFTQSVTAFRIQRLTADLTAQSTVNAVIGYIKQSSAGLSSAFTLDCEPTEIVAIQGSADLASAFTLTAQVNERQGFISTPSSQFVLTADVTVKPPIRITADLTAAFTVTASLVRVQSFRIALTSEFTQTADITKIKGLIANLTASSTLRFNAGRLLSFSATLEVQAFELTAGEVINFAPELTLYVKQETRLRKVLLENRLYALDSESRTRRVLPESRIITIEQQTEVNII